MNYIQDFLRVFQDHMKINNSILSKDLILTYILPFLALLFVINERVWRYSGYISTIYHEVGHGIAALTVFSRIRGIKINGDHSGVTEYLSSNFLPFKIWAAFWGYPFPALIGAVYVATALNGWSGVALNLNIILCLIL